jgi:hypothetical protein
MPAVKAQASTPSLVTDLAALGYYQPDGMAVDKNGNIYVALDASAAIVEIHQDGTVEKLIDTANNVGLAIDQAGNLYYASFWGGIIQELPSGCRDASCVVTLWTAGDPLWNGGRPRGVGVDSAGDVFFTTRPAPGMDEANGTLSVRFVNGTAKVLLYNQDHPNLLSVGPDDCAYWGDSPYLTTNIAEAKRFCLGDTTYEMLWQDTPGASTIYQVRRDPADPNTIYFTKGGDGTLLMLNRTKSQTPIRLVDEGTGTGCSISDAVFSRNGSLLYFDNYLAFQGTCSASAPSSAPSGVIQSNQVATTTYTMSSTESGLKQSSEVAATSTETLSADSIYAVHVGQIDVLTTGADSGSGSVTPICPSGCTETVGSSQTVTATPSSGWQFSSWSTQTGISCSSNPCTFNMPGNAVTLKATFTDFMSAPPSLSSAGSTMFSASEKSVYFIFPDGNTAHAKPAGVGYASVTDWTALGFVYGSLKNMPQTIALDTDSSVIDQSTGAPKVSNKIIVLFGGPLVNEVVHYYESNGIALLHWGLVGGWVSGTEYYYNRLGQPVASIPLSALGPGTKDMGLIEAFTDGAGNTVIIFSGFGWHGTFVAGVYFKTVLISQLPTMPDSWYIYSWTDSNGNGFAEVSEVSPTPVNHGN